MWVRFPPLLPTYNKYRMTQFSNFAYAKLNIEFDHAAFAKEYDQYILPTSIPISTGWHTWTNTRELNKSWNMVPPDMYDQCAVETEFGKVDPRQIPQWQMKQLMQLVTVDNDSDFVKAHAGAGGTFMRNLHLDRTWEIKPEFEHLKIVDFARSLPFTKMVSIHCVSLAPGTFASIHRDVRHNPDVGVPLTRNNGLYQQGFVVITLNISDGGVPLYWSLDGVDGYKLLTVNDPAYMISDYFLHGVPLCSSRRRQVRVTGIPSPELMDLVDHDLKIELPEDYKFDDQNTWYPG
jgi:hypothetical protein